MLWLIEHPRAARAIPIVWPVVQRYIRARYAQQARAIAADVENYLASGLSVRGIVGVAGSPTCGVHSTMDLKLAASALACRRDPATANWINTAVVGPALRPGNGQFIEELTRAMARRHAEVPILEAALPTHASSGAP